MPNAHEVPCTSVVHPAHEPAARHRIEIHAVRSAWQRLQLLLWISEHGRNISTRTGVDAVATGCAQMNLDIPFILQPGIFAPPIAGSTPGPRSGDHVAVNTAKKHTVRKAIAQFDGCRQARAENSKAPGRAARFFRI